ncbi:MAG: hypothetical protein FJX92_02780 [Bacteroidetes bacterium]|nr:hypothetical protein [Bacteroidota bacterium]
MDNQNLPLFLSVLAIVISVLAFAKKQSPAQPAPSGSDTRSLRLQAYERLVLLTERIALPNLISRLAQPGISALEMKVALLENIKQEFDYNSTQQIYVSDVAWDSLRNLKEQNLSMIHQVSASLPPNAGGSELNKRLLELLMQQPGAPLHEIVSKTLNQEAKTLMA